MKDLFDKAYERKAAMWTKKEPPNELISALDAVLPCKAIDIGCGEGYYSVYLAKRGFDVLGIDYSDKAIALAKDNAQKAEVKAIFEVMDVIDIGRLEQKFGLAIEWGVLHHIEPSLWNGYVSSVASALDNGATYITLAFNERSKTYGESGDRVRRTVIGTTIYYSTQKELKELYSKHFEIIKSEIIPFENKVGKIHMGNFFVMRRK